MKAKIVLGLLLGCLLLTLGFLTLSDRTQAQPNPAARILKEPILMWSGTLATIP